MTSDINKNKIIQLPMLAIRGLVLFEGMTLHFDVGRKKSILALKDAMEGGRRIFLTAQMDSTIDDPKISELYQVGVVATVKQMLKGKDDIVHVVVTGDFRAKIVHVDQKTPYVSLQVMSQPLSKRCVVSKNEMEARMRLLKNLFEQYSELIPNMSKDIILEVVAQQDPTQLFRSISFNVMMNVEDRQALLESNRLDKRLTLLISILERECNVLSLERDIYEQVKEQMDKNQRDYYLKEQLRVIQDQLGVEDGYTDDLATIMERISAIQNISDQDRKKLLKEGDRLYKCPPQSQEATVIRTYLEHCLELPWDSISTERVDLKKAQRLLDRHHYGLDHVKQRILEMLAVRKLAPDFKGQIICLVGPPGVGKTSIAKSIAYTLGREYVRISLGGVRDESDIRGHRKTYVGAMPGRIMHAIKQAGSKNPVILLDEIDKMSNDFRGDPSAAMLEVLDVEQNKEFRDHYLELSFDLSEVLFLTTANDLSVIPAPLLDRMEIMELSSYTREEKFHIAKKYLVQKQKKNHGLTSSDMLFSHEGIYTIIDGYTREAGVRKLEQTVAKVCRKVAKQKVSEGDQYKKISVHAKTIETFLGRPRYSISPLPEQHSVGMVTGLAWTSVGGETMEIEAAVYEGSGKVQLTGNLGDVMKESAKLAVSYVRGISKQYNISSDFYKTKDIHIHAPEGAVPKDGPSAGVTMTTALVSVLSGIPVKRDVAMTGEISLRGRVMKIGGLKEKAIAAYRSGVKIVLIPYDNHTEIDQFDEVIKQHVCFVPVRTIAQVLDYALIEKPCLNQNKDSSMMLRNNKPIETSTIASMSSSG